MSDFENHGQQPLRSVNDVFPADDPVARFVLVLWAARNDIEFGVRRIPQSEGPELFYQLRVVMGHIYEAGEALGHYRARFEEVRAFLARLPRDAKRDLARAANVSQQVGGKALAHSRSNTFHYPSPDTAYGVRTSDVQLAEVLASAGDTVVTVNRYSFKTSDGEEHLFDRMATADAVMLMLAMAEHDSRPDQLRKQIGMTVTAGASMKRVAQACWELYQQERNVRVSPTWQGPARGTFNAS